MKTFKVLEYCLGWIGKKRMVIVAGETCLCQAATSPFCNEVDSSIALISVLKNVSFVFVKITFTEMLLRIIYSKRDTLASLLTFLLIITGRALSRAFS